jgi:hypothetical protein
MVVVACNAKDFVNLGNVGTRLGPGTPERSAFIYGVTGAQNLATGFTAVLTLDVNTPVVDVPVEVASLSLGGSPGSLTIIGGDATVPTRSQVIITDLGPIPATEETDAEEAQPSGTGRSQRRTVRPHNRRSA